MLAKSAVNSPKSERGVIRWKGPLGINCTNGRAFIRLKGYFFLATYVVLASIRIRETIPLVQADTLNPEFSFLLQSSLYLNHVSDSLLARNIQISLGRVVLG